MDKDHFPIRLIRESKNKWLYTDIEVFSEGNNEDVIWTKFSGKNSIQSSHVLFIYNLASDHDGMDAMLILTKGCKQYFNLSGLNEQKEIVEVNEYIDPRGTIIKPLEEQEINRILRVVFKLKPKQILISLLNSARNNIHEQSLRNIFFVPGYKCKLSSDIIENITTK